MLFMVGILWSRVSSSLATGMILSCCLWVHADPCKGMDDKQMYI